MSLQLRGYAIGMAGFIYGVLGYGLVCLTQSLPKTMHL
jgi:hypothetical protein